MFVCCECCVLSGRGLCGELITRPEESYRPWCVVVCDLETMIRVGLQHHRKKRYIYKTSKLCPFCTTMHIAAGTSVVDIALCHI
jgi:hypothetical protein